MTGRNEAERALHDISTADRANSKSVAESSRVLCALPWIGLHNQSNGDVFPCCNWTGETLGTLRQSSLPRIMNAEPMKRLRRDMLAGKPNAGCSSCHDNERLGLFSLRGWANENFGANSALLKSTRGDGSLAEPRFRYLHLNFSNLCNLRCRTCSPRRSTAWYQDVAILMRERYGDVPKQIPLTPTQDPADFLRALEPHLTGLHTIQLAGGEPLLAKEHHELLERLVDLKLTHVRLLYNTNLSVLRYRNKDLTRLWSRFENVEFWVSFDASGRRGEYLRKGQRWNEAVANWRRLRRACPLARMNLAPVISLFNAAHIPDFHREWIEAGLIRPDDFHLHVLRAPRPYSIQAYPASMKERLLERFERHLSYLGALTPRPDAVAKVFRGVMKFMTAADLGGELENFRKTTSELDRVRGEKLLDVFPELSELFPSPSASSARSPRRNPPNGS